MPHPFEVAREKVQTMQRQADLLKAVDKFAPPEFLLQLAAVEMLEYQATQDLYGTQEYALNETQGEFDDIVVYYFSWLDTYAKNIDMLATVQSANGYGSHSSAIDQLGPVILDSADNPAQAVPEVINRLASIGLHMPVPYVAFEGMDRTIRKVLSNRHPVLYSEECPILKRPLVDEELVLKYQHLEKGTRMLRRAVDRTLAPSDWQPFYWQLVDWTQSSDNLQAIAVALQKNGVTTVATELEKAKENL